MSKSRWRLLGFAALLVTISLPAATSPVRWRESGWRYDIAVVGRLDSVQHHALPTAFRGGPDGRTLDGFYGIGSVVVAEVIRGPRDLKRVPVLWVEGESSGREWHTDGESGVFLLLRSGVHTDYYWITLLPSDSVEVVREVLKKEPPKPSKAESGTVRELYTRDRVYRPGAEGLPDSIYAVLKARWLDTAGQDYMDAHVVLDGWWRGSNCSPDDYLTIWEITYPVGGATLTIGIEMKPDGTFRRRPSIPPCLQNPENCIVQIDSVTALSIAETALGRPFQRARVGFSYDNDLRRFLWTVSGHTMSNDEWIREAGVELYASDGRAIHVLETRDRAGRPRLRD